jgi:manganese efflux pump family protein
MNFLEILLIALGLSMDCFAVSLSFGTSQKLKWKEIFRMALFFGLFQGLMPLIGWLVGNSLQSFISSIDHWFAFGILAFIGLKMILQSFKNTEERKNVDIRKTTILLSLSVATSIDALITGISFGFIRVNILEAAVIITLITFLVSIFGAKLGEKTTFLPARWAERLGGLVLIGIGVKIVFEHLAAI